MILVGDEVPPGGRVDWRGVVHVPACIVGCCALAAVVAAVGEAGQTDAAWSFPDVPLASRSVRQGWSLRSHALDAASLSASAVICQRGANSPFFRGFSIFGPMHQNFVP